MPTWSGTAFTAFVAAAYSRRIVGWCTAPIMPIELPLGALRMRVARPAPARPSTASKSGCAAVGGW